MTLTILGIVSSVLGFVFWLYRRNAEKSPAEKAKDEHTNSTQEIDRTIATHNERSINKYFNRKLQNIHDNKLRQDNSKRAEGKNPNTAG